MVEGSRASRGATLSEGKHAQVGGVALDLALGLEALVLVRRLRGSEDEQRQRTESQRGEGGGGELTISRVPWLRCSRLTTSSSRSPLPRVSAQTVRQKASIEDLTFRRPWRTNWEGGG